jgi:hypothetical protein
LVTFLERGEGSHDRFFAHSNSGRVNLSRRVL